MTLTSALTATPIDSRVQITRATWVSESSLQVEVKAKQISGDWLMEPPLLLIGEKKILPSAASLKAARFSFLKAVTEGEGSGVLEFEIESAWRSARRGVLVLNPSSTAQSSVAPRLEVGFTWGSFATATTTAVSAEPVSDWRVQVSSASFVSETRLRVEFVSQTGLLLFADVPTLQIDDKTNLLPTSDSLKASTALVAGKRLALEFELDSQTKERGRGRLIFNSSAQVWSGGMSPRIEVVVRWK